MGDHAEDAINEEDQALAEDGRDRQACKRQDEAAERRDFIAADAQRTERTADRVSQQLAVARVR